MIKKSTKAKRDPEICIRCGKPKPEVTGKILDLRANAAIVHRHCTGCGMRYTQFRNMTEDERQTEARRILAEDEARRAAEAEKAEREEAERIAYEAEKAEIILQQRRSRRA